MKTLLLAVCALPWLGAAQAAPIACLAARPVPIVVRIGPNTLPVAAQLRGGVSPQITVEERDSGRVLWTAADAPPAAQVFEAMHAAFAGSFTAIDLDGDGVHDRLYAGDLAGRLWRFDLHHGATPEHWASGGIWADFSIATGRGFVAPVDVSLSTPADQKPYFNIAAGTARTTDSAVSNRFYVLRDKNPFDIWTDVDYRNWRPLHESDLAAVGDPGISTTTHIDKGYYFDLGAADVLSSSLTVSGRATLALSTASNGGSSCQVAIAVSSFEIETAAPVDARAVSAGDEPRAQPNVLPAGTDFVLTQGDAGQALCTLGGAHIAACDVDTRPTPVYWRREDAD